MENYLKQHFKLKYKDDDFLFNCQRINFNYYKQYDLQTLLLYKLYCLLSCQYKIQRNKQIRLHKCELNPDIVEELKYLHLCIQCSLGMNVRKLNYSGIIIFDDKTFQNLEMITYIKRLIKSNKQKQQQIKQICQVFKVYMKLINEEIYDE